MRGDLVARARDIAGPNAVIGAAMIETLLRHRDVPGAVGILWDPIAVSICRAAGPGAEV